VYIDSKIDGEAIRVAIPLTAQNGKARIKQRSDINEYGTPVATRQVPFNHQCYLEWQIGYDVDVSIAEKLELSQLADVRFAGANGKQKALYELSEYVYFLTKWGLVARDAVEWLAQKLREIDRDKLFEHRTDFDIKRRPVVEKQLNSLHFLETRVEYPLVIHKFGDENMLAEIITREKQRAVGVQPMLFFCVPVSMLEPGPKQPGLIGRTADQNEVAHFVINRANASVMVQLLHLFGMLSANHRKDVLSILEKVARIAPTHSD